jgi:hypothetical protein
VRGLVGTRISSAEQMDIFGLRIWYIKLLMVNGKQIITRCFAILILCGIILVGGYGLYMSFRDFDKPVPVVTKTDSIGRPFEINGYMFYLRNDALYDESGNMVADLSIENNRTNKNVQASPSLKDVLTEGLGYENKGFEDFSIFGYSKEEV